MLDSFFSYIYQGPSTKEVSNGDAILASDWNNNFYALSKGISNLVNAFSNNSDFYTWQNVNDWEAQLKIDIAYNMNPQDMSWGEDLTINSNGITNKAITINDATFTYTNTNTITIGNDKIEIKNGNTILYTTEQDKDQTILTPEITSRLIDERFKFENTPTEGIVKKWTLHVRSIYNSSTILDILNNTNCCVLSMVYREIVDDKVNYYPLRAGTSRDLRYSDIKTTKELFVLVYSTIADAEIDINIDINCLPVEGINSPSCYMITYIEYAVTE